MWTPFTANWSAPPHWRNLIHEKTTGNPFFAIQFISTLADDRLLTFDYGARRWVWDLIRIRAKGFTDNVVELMVGKLKRLPPETQKVLQQFACMGNSAEFEMLRMGYQGSVEDMHDHLWEAVRSGLIFRADDSYGFLHDRVQEAAYSLIPKELRAEAHLRIGMLLAEHTPAEKREEAIFEIVNQLNRGSHLITSVEDRERVAELNLIAGRRAKLSTAYDSALKYLRAGRALLAEETWERNHAAHLLDRVSDSRVRAADRHGLPRRRGSTRGSAKGMRERPGIC